MKDTIITGKRKKTELIILICCFVFAELINIYSILKYKSSWKEIYSMLHVVIILTVLSYFLVFFFRFLFKLIFCKKNKQ